MRIDIKQKMDEKGLNRYKLGTLIGVTYPAITAIYNGDVSYVKFETLEKLCKVLECTPNDILLLDNSSACDD